jgi:hypothetical protein
MSATATPRPGTKRAAVAAARAHVASGSTAPLHIGAPAPAPTPAQIAETRRRIIGVRQFPGRFYGMTTRGVFVELPREEESRLLDWLSQVAPEY